MNTIAFIPARSGSKGVKDKNIRLLGGKPLIAWSIETALASGLRTIVSTDSNEYADIARSYGADVMMRPSELAQDETSMFEVLKSEVPKIFPVPDIVLLLQPTTPFRGGINLIALAEELAGVASSIVSVERVPDKYNPDQVLVDGSQGWRMASGCSIANRKTARQDFDPAFVPTGALYAFKTKNLEGGDIYGSKMLIFETWSTININTENDFLEAERFLTSKSQVQEMNEDPADKLYCIGCE